jgi:hypothetical protein
VITLSVVQVAGVFQLDGFDDECGGAFRSAVNGTAFQNPGGSIGMGLTVVTPGGRAFHLDAILGISTLSGSWRSDTGAMGAWVFTPGPGHPGPPRPAPAETLVVEGPGVAIPATLVTQTQFTALNETVVIPRTGRLSINKSLTNTLLGCGGSAFLLFITVDGVPIRNSAIYLFGAFSGVLSGVTLNPVAAGSHVLGIGGQCFSGTPSGSGLTTVTISSVTVLP